MYFGLNDAEENLASFFSSCLNHCVFADKQIMIFCLKYKHTEQGLDMDFDDNIFRLGGDLIDFLWKLENFTNVSTAERILCSCIDWIRCFQSI